MVGYQEAQMKQVRYDKTILALIRYITSWDEVTVDEKVEEGLIKTVSLLPPKERFVISSHYGIGGAKRLTLSQIGDVLGVSKERIRYIEGRAIRRLRHPLWLRCLNYNIQTTASLPESTAAQTALDTGSCVL
jgi:RNA polymerase sigma factor (sigma-70 family)